MNSSQMSQEHGVIRPCGLVNEFADEADCCHKNRTAKEIRTAPAAPMQNAWILFLARNPPQIPQAMQAKNVTANLTINGIASPAGAQAPESGIAQLASQLLRPFVDQVPISREAK